MVDREKQVDNTECFTWKDIRKFKKRNTTENEEVTAEMSENRRI
jgi:hypothetical protein